MPYILQEYSIAGLHTRKLKLSDNLRYMAPLSDYYDEIDEFSEYSDNLKKDDEII